MTTNKNRNHAQACSSMLKLSNVCSSMLKHTNVNSSYLKHAQAISSMPEHLNIKYQISNILLGQRAKKDIKVATAERFLFFYDLNMFISNKIDMTNKKLKPVNNLLTTC